MDTLKQMVHVGNSRFVQVWSGPHIEYPVKSLLKLLVCMCLFICFTTPISSKGENEVMKEEIRIVEAHNMWTQVFQQYSKQAIPVSIDPESEDILLIANIVVKSLHLDSYENYVPFLMKHDSGSHVWIVSYYELDSHGNQQLGGEINIAIHDQTLQVLLIWYDE